MAEYSLSCHMQQQLQKLCSLVGPDLLQSQFRLRVASLCAGFDVLHMVLHALMPDLGPEQHLLTIKQYLKQTHGQVMQCMCCIVLLCGC